MSADDTTTRLATPDDADELARRLVDFNVEFDVASPPVDEVSARLRVLLGGDDTIAIVAGHPIVGLALVTLRPNVWYPGPVALLDELYVVPDRRNRGIGTAIVGHLLALARARGVGLIEINVDEPDVDAQRFYERQGFSGVDPDTQERAFYYSRELASAGPTGER
jgi:GNAT superfamily N-acetyltransferase